MPQQKVIIGEFIYIAMSWGEIDNNSNLEPHFWGINCTVCPLEIQNLNSSWEGTSFPQEEEGIPFLNTTLCKHFKFEQSKLFCVHSCEYFDVCNIFQQGM